MQVSGDDTIASARCSVIMEERTLLPNRIRILTADNQREHMFAYNSINENRVNSVDDDIYMEYGVAWLQRIVRRHLYPIYKGGIALE